ncbi:MAG: hypothetical protein WHT06_01635 [Desulfobacterales bacterium]
MRLADSQAPDERLRSLMQKALRRGHVDLLLTACAYLEHSAPPPPSFFPEQAARGAFYECWPLANRLPFARRPTAAVALLSRMAALHKTREAAGLGLLADAMARGEPVSAPGEEEEGGEGLRRVAQALRAPEDFLAWLTARGLDAQALLQHAGIRRVPQSRGRPHDRAVAFAALYLLGTRPDTPPPPPAPPPDEAFPFWVVFDRHTAAGRLALRDVARDLKIPQAQLEWCYALFEGLRLQAEIPSPWWRRYCRNRFDRIGLPLEEAHLLWEPAKTQLYEALAAEGRALQGELYRWKLEHGERVENLRNAVAAFWKRLEELPKEQRPLFG